MRLYYEFPLTAGRCRRPRTQIELLKDQITRRGYEADLGRAQILFGARRYAEARAAFRRHPRPTSAATIASWPICASPNRDFHLKNYAAARDGLRPYLEKASRLAEARFFYLSAISELGDRRRSTSR